jgi:hypothetical protein
LSKPPFDRHHKAGPGSRGALILRLGSQSPAFSSSSRAERVWLPRRAAPKATTNPGPELVPFFFFSPSALGSAGLLQIKKGARQVLYIQSTRPQAHPSTGSLFARQEIRSHRSHSYLGKLLAAACSFHTHTHTLTLDLDRALGPEPPPVIGNIHIIHTGAI